ncbi:hypothetical protein LCGC14_2557200 [marine sediment metagenome]|uniref:ParB-like N-terminal domain-containing protein n=1 Tax=marine sediment metagenome TaxID=412755 RepID=A0A0F9CXE9_9ZZZZ
MNQIKHIRLDKLLPPEFDQRITTSPEEDLELTESIRELGVLCPLIIKTTSNGFEIVAGHRRFICAGRAGLAAVPCIVVKSDAAASEKIKLHENLKRLPLSHLDQAYTFAHLRKIFSMTETQISSLCGVSIAYISQHLSLLSCDDSLISSVHDGRINFSVARELMLCKNPDEQKRFLKYAEDDGATCLSVQNWVRESNRETSILDGSDPKVFTSDLPSTPQIPMYPCRICDTPTEIPQLIVVRLCKTCDSDLIDTIRSLIADKRD